MSRPVNAFFKIHINGQLTHHTPVAVLSGVLHCVEDHRPDGSVLFWPVAYYAKTNLTLTPVNSLKSIREHPFDCTSTGFGETFDITTDTFRITNVGGVLAVTTTPYVAYTEYCVSFRPLHVSDAPMLEDVPSYNEVDSDVVLTSATPTSRTHHHHPVGNEVLLRSKVLTLIYSALYTHSATHPDDPEYSSYILLADLQDMEQDATGSPTSVWTFHHARPYDVSTGKFAFHSDVELTCRIVDRILDSIAPSLLQRNDTLDITVNDVDQTGGELYTTSLRYSGEDPGDPGDPGDSREATPSSRYRDPLFPGLLESNPTTYANKHAVCIAMSRYDKAGGVNTRAFPPFQFSYKTADQFTVLDEVRLDFERYYYVVYHFAPAVQVRALPLFSRPTTNQAALRDVLVLSDKHDAYVDLGFRVGESQYNLFTSSSAATSAVVSRIAVTYTLGATPRKTKRRAGAASAPTETHEMTVGGAGRGRYQFFTSESDLYTSRAPDREPIGPKMRLYFDAFGPAGGKHKIPSATTNVRITVELSVDGRGTRLVATITQPHILQYTDPRNAALIELCYQPGVPNSPTPTAILDAVRSTNDHVRFNDDISQWDLYAGSCLGGLHSLEGLLRGMQAFDQPLGCWNTSGIRDMRCLFEGASTFNQPIGVWETSRVTTLAGMFKGASRFNQDLSDWDVRDVLDFSETFAAAVSFDGPIGGWQCRVGDASGAVVDATRMFDGAASFDRPFASTGFTVSRCVGMFHAARSFNRPWRHILSEACADLTEMFKGAKALVGSGTHDLPAGCVNTTSMFEGASSWNTGLVSDNAPLLANMTAMYKGATRFNRPVSVTTSAETLCCDSMFEGALAMDSHVVLRSDASGGWIALQDMFRGALTFNKDVLFNRQILRCSRMFKGAWAYGQVGENGRRPSLGVAGYVVVDFGPSPVSASPFARDAYVVSTPSEAGASEMFAGTQFNDHVCGRAPTNCTEMFAGAEYYTTPLNMSGYPFDMRGVTSMTRMFKGAIALTVNPIQANPSVLSGVTAMDGMFEDATLFNGDLTSWRDALASVTTFAGMFRNAVSYKTNITSGVHKWSIGNGVDLDGMFSNARSYPFGDLYSFPRLIATTRSVPTVTLGQPLTMTTRFVQWFPPSARATVLVASQDPTSPSTSLVADVSGNTIAATFNVQSDTVHMGLVTVVYGTESQTYTWDYGILTDADIYVFPSDFSYRGTRAFGVGLTLKQNTPCDLVLEFAGGDRLFSSVVSEQVEYVRYGLGGVVTTVAPASILCSDASGTITILGLAPTIAMADLTLQVRLRGPDGALCTEMVRIVPAHEIAPEWLPVAAVGVTTTSVPAPYKLVVGADVWLHFAFSTTAAFPTGLAASELFQLVVNGVPTDITTATVDATARTIRVSHRATGLKDHSFAFLTFGQTYTFSIPAVQVYEFPGIVRTERSVPFVTFGQALTLTSYFASHFPPEVTGNVLVSPHGHDATAYTADVSDGMVAVTIPAVSFDVPHTGAITLWLGDTLAQYAWAAHTLTADDIYTFPTRFSYARSSVFGTRIALKQNTPLDLVLTFHGGDRLFSSVTSTQVEYVSFVQQGATTTVDASSLRCSDASGTVTILGIAPVGTADLTLHVRLRGPDGALSAEMTQTVPTLEIAPEWLPTDASGVVANIQGTAFRLIVDSPVQLAFTFASAVDFPASSPASDLLMLSVITRSVIPSTTAEGEASTSLASATVSARTITLLYTATAMVEHRFVFTSFYGTAYTFIVGASEVYTLPALAVSSYHIQSSPDDLSLGAFHTTGVVMVRAWTLT